MGVMGLAKLFVAQVPIHIRWNMWPYWSQLAVNQPWDDDDTPTSSYYTIYLDNNSPEIAKHLNSAGLIAGPSVSGPKRIKPDSVHAGNELFTEVGVGRLDTIMNDPNAQSMSIKFMGVRRWAKAGPEYGFQQSSTAANGYRSYANSLASSATESLPTAAYQIGITPATGKTLQALKLGEYVSSGLPLSSQIVELKGFDSAWNYALFNASRVGNKGNILVVKSATIDGHTTKPYIGTGPNDPYQQTEQYYITSGTAEFEVKSRLETVTIAGLYYDDVTQQLTLSNVPLDSAGISEFNAFRAIQKAKDAELFSAAKQREAGFDVKLDLKRPNIDYESPVVSEQANAWWDAWLTEAQKVNGLSVGDMGPGYDAWKLGNPQGSLDNYRQYIASKATTDATTARDNPPAWSSLWDGLSSAAKGMWDYVKTWSPTQWLAGYAGYKAVKSASKSNIPMWVIVGGIGLTALAIIN